MLCSPGGKLGDVSAKSAEVAANRYISIVLEEVVTMLGATPGRRNNVSGVRPVGFRKSILTKSSYAWIQLGINVIALTQPCCTSFCIFVEYQYIRRRRKKDTQAIGIMK